MTNLERIAFDQAYENLLTFREKLIEKNTISGHIEKLNIFFVKKQFDGIIGPLKAIKEHDNPSK